MSKIKRCVIPYKIEHLEIMMGYIRELEQSTYDKINRDYRTWHKTIVFETPEPKTFIVDGKPIAIGGIAILWDGVGEAWIIGSKYFRDNYMFITKECIKYTNDIVKRYNLRRLQALTKSGDKDLVRYAQFMNFNYEGELRNYGMDGSNQYMFSRIP